ncbi:hypothetical protein NKG94_06310 [Micromonospora sp. M12]
MHLDSISWRILTDASIRAANLRSGDAQVADSVSTQDVASLRQDAAVSVLQSQSLGYQGLTINIGNVDGVGTAPSRSTGPSRRTPRCGRPSSTPSTARRWSTPSSTACTRPPAHRSRRRARSRLRRRRPARRTIPPRPSNC